MPMCIPNAIICAVVMVTVSSASEQESPEFCNIILHSFGGVERIGDEIRWSKTMDAPVQGTDIHLTYHHMLRGPAHTIRVEAHGKGAEGRPAHFRLCPYFHQGWDPPIAEKITDPRIPDPRKVGQERNVFGFAGRQEFVFSESNDKHIFVSSPLGRQRVVSLWSCQSSTATRVRPTVRTMTTPP